VSSCLQKATERFGFCACAHNQLQHSQDIIVNDTSTAPAGCGDAGCGGPGLVWVFSETPLETAYGREMNIQFNGNSPGGHSCSQRMNVFGMLWIVEYKSVYQLCTAIEEELF